MGAAGEDIEDQLGAVDDLDFGHRRDGADLGRRQILVEHQQCGPHLQTANDDLLDLPLPHQIAGVELTGALHHPVQHQQIGGAGQLRQLVQGILDVLAGLLTDGNQDRLLPGVGEIDGFRHPPFQLGIEPPQKGPEIEIEMVDGGGTESLDAALARPRGEQIGVMHRTRQAVIADAQGHHQIQAQQRQVVEVVLRQGLALEVGMDAAQAPQAAAAEAIAAEIRDDDLPVVTDDDVQHRPLAVENDADLPVQLPGALGEIARQFRTDQLAGGNPSPVDALERLQLTRLESGEVTLNHALPLGKKKGPEPGPCCSVVATQDQAP